MDMFKLAKVPTWDGEPSTHADYEQRMATALVTLKVAAAVPALNVFDLDPPDDASAVKIQNAGACVALLRSTEGALTIAQLGEKWTETHGTEDDLWTITSHITRPPLTDPITSQGPIHDYRWWRSRRRRRRRRWWWDW
jgi:hypothetical protein